MTCLAALIRRTTGASETGVQWIGSSFVLEDPTQIFHPRLRLIIPTQKSSHTLIQTFCKQGSFLSRSWARWSIAFSSSISLIAGMLKPVSAVGFQPADVAVITEAFVLTRIAGVCGPQLPLMIGLFTVSLVPETTPCTRSASSHGLGISKVGADSATTELLPSSTPQHRPIHKTGRATSGEIPGGSRRPTCCIP